MVEFIQVIKMTSLISLKLYFFLIYNDMKTGSISTEINYPSLKNQRNKFKIYILPSLLRKDAKNKKKCRIIDLL